MDSSILVYYCLIHPIQSENQVVQLYKTDNIIIVLHVSANLLLYTLANIFLCDYCPCILLIVDDNNYSISDLRAVSRLQ